MGDVAAVLARFGRKAADLAQQREYYETMADDLPIPSETEIAAIDLAGIPAERISAKNVRSDAAVLLFHGGGYVVGSSRAYRSLAAIISADTQATCFSVDYRLAPEHVFPAAVEDTTTAYRGLLDQGFVPKRIAFAGDSAGGGLVLATLLNARNIDLPMPAAGYAMSPWLDLGATGPSFVENADIDRVMTSEGALGCAKTYLQGADPRHPLASPIYANLAGLPPLLLQVGSTEMFLDDSTRLARQAALAGVHVELQIWPGMPHVWQRFAAILPEGREAVNSAGAFIKSRLQHVVA